MVTTVLLYDYDPVEPQLLCWAHSKGVRLVYGATFKTEDLTNATARRIYVQQQVDRVKNSYTDGLNMDYEELLAAGSPEAKGYTSLIQELNTAFKAAIPSCQFTVDVAWSPNCTDDRCYDHAAIAAATDFLFIMAYDMQSQIWGDCIAMANSPPDRVEKGIRSFMALGIPPKKLVLGVPWYAYDYPCLDSGSGLLQRHLGAAPVIEVCKIKPVPFRGCPCSDAAGTQIEYYKAKRLLPSSFTGRVWNSTYQSPMFIYRFNDNATSWMPSSSLSNEYPWPVHEVWYDDAESLGYKYRLAKNLGLRGVGMWGADFLAYDGTPQERAEAVEMWQALRQGI